MIGKTTLQQYSDALYNKLKADKGWSKLLEYNLLHKLGDKKAFEMLFQVKQGNRDYIEKMIGTTYPPENVDE